MASRTWIKIYCDKWLNGTIREESLEVRAVWVDLLVLAGSGKYGDSGEIKITDSIGLLDQQLADLLQISTRKWKIISKRLQETDRICITERNVIAIKNWAKYQSEYERQKDQRIRDGILKSAGQSAIKSAEASAARDREGDREERLEKENKERESSSLSIEDILTLYKKMVGFQEEESLDEIVENDIKATVNIFTPPWVADAIREAVKRNRKNWFYVAGILKNWKRYGKNTKMPSGDLDKYIKGKYGHMVQR
jgi:DnaD/phage-associated family protein